MLYFFCNREEKIERTIIRNQKVFSTKKLDLTMQNVVERIDYKIKEVKREYTTVQENPKVTPKQPDKYSKYKEKQRTTSYYFYFIMAKIIFSVFHNA